MTTPTLTELPAELLSILRIRPLRYLGGRLNEHWLVETDDKKRVVRKWGEQSSEAIAYECDLLTQVARLGWPVASLNDPIEIEGQYWSLGDYLEGEPSTHGGPDEQKARGRLLAQFHQDVSSLQLPSQRPGWRRCEEILSDPDLDKILFGAEATHAEEVRIVRWHLERARLRAETLKLHDRVSIPIHGDFTPWNLHYQGTELTGLFDFELSRNDHRIADFALSWRGKYDAVIEGYEEVSPLEPEEKAALVPVWWSELIEGACRNLKVGRDDDGWTVNKLLVRSKMLGPDASEAPSS